MIATPFPLFFSWVSERILSPKEEMMSGVVSVHPSFTTITESEYSKTSFITEESVPALLYVGISTQHLSCLNFCLQSSLVIIFGSIDLAL